MKSSVTALLLLLSLCIQTANADLIEESARFLSSDELKGRVSGTEENKVAMNYLIEKMKDLKIEPAGDNGTYQNRFEKGTNLVGIIRPKKNSNSKDLPTVMIGAHYDHVDHCRSHIDARSPSICNGAADNAAAVAAVLGAIEGLSDTILAPVAIVFWDAEEQGLLGSMAFSKKPSFDNSKLKLYINLDIVGMNLFRGAEASTFVVGAETGGSSLQSDVTLATKNLDVKFNQVSYAFGHYRSDMTSFILNKYELPFAFFSDGDGAVYHSDADEFEKLNLNKVRTVSKAITNLASIASSKKEDYEYLAPKIYLTKETVIGRLFFKFLFKYLHARNGVVLPEFSDAAVVEKLFSTAIENQKENLLDAQTVQALIEERAKIQRIIKDGQKSFSLVKRFKLAQSAQKLLKTARELTFIP